MKPFIKPGASVWILSRQRTRAGKGPLQVMIADLSNGLCRAAGTRGWYFDREVFETAGEAHAAWVERSEHELAAERSRFNKIATRLTAWERAPSTHPAPAEKAAP